MSTPDPGTTRSDIRVMSAAHLDIEESEHESSVRLKLTGELDLASAPALRQRLDRLRADGSSVLLDLSELGFIDSSGIHLIVQTLQVAQQDGWRVRISPDLSPPVCRLFRLLDLERLIVDAQSNGF